MFQWQTPAKTFTEYSLDNCSTWWTPGCTRSACLIVTLYMLFAAPAWSFRGSSAVTVALDSRLSSSSPGQCHGTEFLCTALDCYSNLLHSAESNSGDVTMSMTVASHPGECRILLLNALYFWRASVSCIEHFGMIENLTLKSFKQWLPQHGLFAN